MPCSLVNILNTSASKQLTESDSNPHIQFPKWFDKDRFDRSRTVIHDNFLAIFFNHLSGLVLLVFIKSIYTTLSLTGKSKNYSSTFYRYMRTVLKVRIWYEGKVYDPHDDASSTLLEVRRMHQQVSYTQNRDRKLDQELAISQRDMVLTQFAFVGLIVLHPTKFGIHKDVPETLERLIYFWKVIGSLLGIKDEYNLCNGNLFEVKQKCEIVFNECFRPSLKDLDEDMFKMCRQILVGSEEWVYCTRFRSTIRYLFETILIKHDKILENFTFIESFCYIALKNVMTYGLRFAPVRFLLNQLFSLAVWRLGRKSFVEAIVEHLKVLDIGS